MLTLVSHTGLIVLHTRVLVQLHSSDWRDRKFQLKVLARGESMTYFMQFPCHAVKKQWNRTVYATSHFWRKKTLRNLNKLKIFGLSHFLRGKKLLKSELDENIWFESLLKEKTLKIWIRWKYLVWVTFDGRKVLLKFELDENIWFESLLKENKYS